MEPTPERFQILSLDGGGIKGLFSAAILAAIEEDINIKVVDHFDLLTGTSSGGIIALGLGLGMSPREIVEFYLSEGHKIFPGFLGIKGFQHWLFRKFSQKPLMESLQECFGDKRLGESRKRLVIPSYNLGEDDVYLFRTPHHERLRRDHKVPVWKVALATSAAPTFFPCCKHIDSLRLIDGGVWANNPTMVALVEAISTLRVPLQAIRVLSLGTSDEINHRERRLNSGGIIAWALGNVAVDVILKGQSIAAHNQAALLLGQENVVRVNPKVTKNEFSLDGVTKVEDLIGKASHHSRTFMPIFQKMFKPHCAAPYSPVYS